MKKSELPDWCKVGAEVVRVFPSYGRTVPQTAAIQKIDSITSAGVIVVEKVRFQFPRKRVAARFSGDRERKFVRTSTDFAKEMDCLYHAPQTIYPATKAKREEYAAAIRLRARRKAEDDKRRAERQRQEAEAEALRTRRRAALDSLLEPGLGLSADEREVLEFVREQFGEIG